MIDVRKMKKEITKRTYYVSIVDEIQLRDVRVFIQFIDHHSSIKKVLDFIVQKVNA